MDKKIINLHSFTLKLAKYKNTLIEMSELTDEEINRVSSLKINMEVEEHPLVKQTAIFMHFQVAVFLNDLGELVNELPTYSLTKDTFLTKEIKVLQEQALVKLKELADTDIEKYLKRFEI